MKLFACKKFNGNEPDFEDDPMANYCEECSQCRGCHSEEPDSLIECGICQQEACESDSIWEFVNGKTDILCVGCYGELQDKELANA